MSWWIWEAFGSCACQNNRVCVLNYETVQGTVVLCLPLKTMIVWITIATKDRASVNQISQAEASSIDIISVSNLISAYRSIRLLAFVLQNFE